MRCKLAQIVVFVTSSLLVGRPLVHDIVMESITPTTVASGSPPFKSNRSAKRNAVWTLDLTS
jgi:hypothetical protein